MKFFLDTANIKEIENLIPTGFVDGVTTNPSLLLNRVMIWLKQLRLFVL